MDSLISAAARALAADNALGALKRIALRNDPPALALRGIARSSASTRTRCDAAEAEVALPMHDLNSSPRACRLSRPRWQNHRPHFIKNLI